MGHNTNRPDRNPLASLRRRTALLLAFAFLLVAGNRAFAQDEQENPLHTASRVELDIVKAVLAEEKAWNRGDLAAFESGYKNSPSTIFMTSTQISRGFAQMAEDYKHNYPTEASMGTLEFSELEAHPLNDTFAVCIGKYHLDRSKKQGGPADGQFSLVLEKTPDGWKIVLDHTT
jgi:ketosteroid isomerase-like protein